MLDSQELLTNLYNAFNPFEPLPAGEAVTESYVMFLTYILVRSLLLSACVTAHISYQNFYISS